MNILSIFQKLAKPVSAAQRRSKAKSKPAAKESKSAVQTNNESLSRRNQIVTVVAVLLVIGGALYAANYFARGLFQGRGLTPEEQQLSEQLDKSNQPTPEPNSPFQPADISPQPGSTYKIQEGDSLSQIAADLTGDPNRWSELAQANNIENPNVIVPGQEIKIPDNFKKTEETQQTAQAQTTPEPSQAANEPVPTLAPNTGGAEPSTSAQHVVLKGETLWSIAEQYYGSGFEWYKLKEANADKVQTLNNGKPWIEVGITLTIPLSAATSPK